MLILSGTYEIAIVRKFPRLNLPECGSDKAAAFGIRNPGR